MHNFPFKSKNRDTVYHFAAKASNIEILKKATKRDLNQRDHEFRTPTHWAAFKGNLKALIVVLSKGYELKLFQLKLRFISKYTFFFFFCFFFFKR